MVSPHPPSVEPAPPDPSQERARVGTWHGAPYRNAASAARCSRLHRQGRPRLSIASRRTPVTLLIVAAPRSRTSEPALACSTVTPAAPSEASRVSKMLCHILSFSAAAIAAETSTPTAHHLTMEFGTSCLIQFPIRSGRKLVITAQRSMLSGQQWPETVRPVWVRRELF